MSQTTKTPEFVAALRNYSALYQRCERISKMRTEYARKLCKEAGLDPSLLGIHPHNAMCSLEYGKPWPEVDYSKCRACIRQLNMPSPFSVLTRLYDRIGQRAFADMRGGV